MRFSSRLALLSASILTLTGCVVLGDKLDTFRWKFMTLPLYVFDNAPGYKNPPQPEVIDERVNLAIAVSGGGSRSALFSAGVLEQLATIPDPRHPGRTVLDGVDVISGVSGGSLSTTYYSLYKPNDFSNQDETQKFFNQYKSNMTVDFHTRGFAHYLTHPWEAVGKYYTRYRFVQTLGEAFDQHIYRGANFNHLLERELKGEAPTTIINATSLDTGQKFLFTNLNIQQNYTFNPVDLISRLPSVAPKSDHSGLSLIAKTISTPVFQPFGFDSINSDIGQFRLSHAVAISCAYPVVPGPATLLNYAQPGYVHLADGGVNDNSGIDSILGLYMAKLQKSPKPKKLVVLSIGVSQPIEPKRAHQADGYNSTIDYADRAAATLATRAQTMSSVLFNAPDSIQVIDISFPAATYSKQLDSTMAALAISERDSRTILNAAIELTLRNKDQIINSLKK